MSPIPRCVPWNWAETGSKALDWYLEISDDEIRLPSSCASAGRRVRPISGVRGGVGQAVRPRRDHVHSPLRIPYRLHQHLAGVSDHMGLSHSWRPPPRQTELAGLRPL